jgi:hypothetical protein
MIDVALSKENALSPQLWGLLSDSWKPCPEDGIHEDVVFECFHNFVAFSQWGNTIYNIMLKLRRDGDPDARAWFHRTMQSSFDPVSGIAGVPASCSRSTCLPIS